VSCDSDAGAPQRKLRHHNREEEQTQPVVQTTRRRRKRSLPSDGDEDYQGPRVVQPTTTVVGDHHDSQCEDPSDDSSDASSTTSSDSATAVGSEFNPSGGEQERCSDDDGDVDPMHEQEAAEDKKAWNTPEGWHKFRKYLKRYSNEMADFGHVCAICGERRHRCVQVSSQTLLDWHIAEDYNDLLDDLYPQYPKKSHDDGVCKMSKIVIIVSKRFFGCAIDATPKA